MDTIGKSVGQRTYIHHERIAELDPALWSLVARAKNAFPEGFPPIFNLVRVDPGLQEVAFLDYPQLGVEPFPALASSWRVHIPSQLITNRRYDQSLNPPILHRTELILPPSHPIRDQCLRLTAQCAQIGLFDNPSIIGFKRTWLRLIQEKGYHLIAFDLLPLGNVQSDEVDDAWQSEFKMVDAVYRHLTALSRSSLSAPVQSLVRDGLLQGDVSLFDYGCGKGDDLATLEASGFQVSGWDPYYRPNATKRSADVVNLGFVINIIESKDERIEALLGAYALARKVLCVSAMLLSNDSGRAQPFADGVLTSRRTFQKYYSQSELQHFIENVLDEDAYPAAPGIFYVFRDRTLEQTYLQAKSSNRSRVARARLAVIRHVRASAPTRVKQPRRDETPEALDHLERLWDLCLELGRPPEAEEISDTVAIADVFGSVNRAIKRCLSSHDPNTLDKAAHGRRDDILVMLALRSFERRKHLNVIEPRLKRDIRLFFGSMQMAEAKAQALLFSVKDKDLLAKASEDAASLGLGWLEPGQSLQLHTSLAERLPAILRVYIGCATAIAGDLKVFDLVKIHIRSGKVSLLSFDDFEAKPLPALQTRIKVRLLDQDLDIFSYGEAYPPSVLFNKSRFVNEEFPFYAEQVAFEESFSALKAFDLSAYGPSEAELHKTLQRLRWEIHGFCLMRSHSIPALSDRCGAHYRFSDLIQCGETWERLRVDNTPCSPETYSALVDLAIHLLDPVIDYFGSVVLTYGFASKALTKHIKYRIEPAIDQHSSCEIGVRGALICSRQGAAVDFRVEDEDMREVAKWIAGNCPFDRMYFYGSDKPLHVSVGPERSGKIYELIKKNGRRVPKAMQFS
jgi:DNA phosphorothioation-associated putative methyltransferase